LPLSDPTGASARWPSIFMQKLLSAALLICTFEPACGSRSMRSSSVCAHTAPSSSSTAQRPSPCR
jgi:hypothetical protein